MGAEIGATTSIFPFDDAHGPLPARDRTRASSPTLADGGGRRPAAPTTRCWPTPSDYFDEVIEIDLSTLEPHLVGPHTPDLARPVSADGGRGARPRATRPRSRAALIGSCTNSSYEDISRAADVARQAAEHGLSCQDRAVWSPPGSEQVRATIERDGQLADLEAIGATVLANACGPCIGQWKRDDIDRRARPTRSSPRSTATSPSATTATPRRWPSSGARRSSPPYALAGTVEFNPLTDTHRPTPTATRFTLAPPRRRRSCRRSGFVPGDDGFVAPPADGERGRGRRSPRTASGSSCSSPSRLGRQGLRASCRCCSRPRASARPTTSRRPARGCASAATSTTSRQHVHRRDQRLHRRGRRRARTSSTATTKPVSRRSPAHYKRGRPALGRRRRRELRRGLAPRARGDVAALPGRAP